MGLKNDIIHIPLKAVTFGDTWSGHNNATEAFVIFPAKACFFGKSIDTRQRITVFVNAILRICPGVNNAHFDRIAVVRNTSLTQGH